MTKISEIFGGRSLSAEEFEAALAGSGYSLFGAEEKRALEKRLEEQKAEFESELTRSRVSAALKYELKRRGAHNVSLAAAAIGIDGFAGDEKDAEAFAEEKVEKFRREEPYMFADAKGSPVSTGASHGESAPDTDSMSDSEYYNYIKIN
ncbi:MAG: hypothetical protein MJ096_01555 [Clostridia bacterium]|nr:hypothetical protein [Clostridia bacterium]